MKLFICEKPSQAKDIASVLGVRIKTEHCFEGDNIAVTWCIGHLLELAPPDSYCDKIKPWRMEILPIVPDTWQIQPQVKTKKQLTAIGKLLKKAGSVVIATDADREGDVIGREVLDYFNYKGKVERLLLSALDESSIKKALAEIRDGSSTENLYQAGLGRQRADWLIGMNLTMAVSALHGIPGQGVLSVGRVQTPTLKLVVDRDLSIEQFKPHDYFVLKAQFENTNQDYFWLTLDIPEDEADEEGRCVNLSFIEDVSQKITNQQGTVTEFSETRKKTSPPLCFSLSTLQKLASSQFGLSAKQTLETAQSLYEKHKATTYPRTDCGFLPESQLKEANQILSTLKKIDESISPLIAKSNPKLQTKTWNDAKITAHHGIIPTSNPHVDLSSMSMHERKVYELIRSHYIAQFLGDYEYLQTRVEVKVDDYQFKGGCNTPLVAGFKEALHGIADKEEGEEISDENSHLIPALKKGENLCLDQTKIDSRKTKPAARFTEGTLITAMKSIAKFVEDSHLKKILKDTAGIGTEATRANILETLINREYLRRERTQLISTKKGRELINLLPQSITNPTTTALWEQILDSIATGDAAVEDFLDDQRDALEGMLDQLAKEEKFKGMSGQIDRFDCPECQKQLIRRKGNNGYWWGCSCYPDCKRTFLDNHGKPNFTITKKERVMKKPDEKCITLNLL